MDDTGTVITVFGSMGFIGKSTIATNLATALVHNAKQSVVVVDLNTRFGDLAVLMDIPFERSIVDLAIPEEEITRDIVEECLSTHKTGVSVLPAPSRHADWRNVRAGHIERVVQLLVQSYDYVILDTPGTFNDIVARALEIATMVLLVCTVDMANVKDTLLAIDMLRSWNVPEDKIKLVVNSTNEASNVQLDEIRRMLGHEVFWSVPYDRNISTATQLGVPLVAANPQSEAAESLTGLAYALSSVNQQRAAAVGQQATQGGNEQRRGSLIDTAYTEWLARKELPQDAKAEYDDEGEYEWKQKPDGRLVLTAEAKRLRLNRRQRERRAEANLIRQAEEAVPGFKTREQLQAEWDERVANPREAPLNVWHVIFIVLFTLAAVSIFLWATGR